MIDYPKKTNIVEFEADNRRIVKVNDGLYFEVDKITSDVLAVCDGRHFNDIIKVLQNEYKEADILSVLQELELSGLIVSDDSPVQSNYPPGILNELCIYLQQDLSFVQEKVNIGSDLLATEWRMKNPQTSSEILSFYRETENYIFDLSFFHMQPYRQKWTHNIIRFCTITNASSRGRLRKVLDYGCGIGTDGIVLAQKGFKITLADLPGKTLDFAKWRLKQRKLSAKILEINDDAPIQDTYDYVICLEVLEHLYNPIKTIQHIYKHLNQGGFMLTTVSFEHTDFHPMHLARNEIYKGYNFIRIMKDYGFQPINVDSKPMIFRK